MSSGSNYLTTYYAKRIIGDNAAADSASALLQTGENITTNTWLLEQTERGQNVYGIQYRYDNDGHDSISMHGGNASVATAWVQLDTGKVYILGNVGIGAEPDTHKLYVEGNAFFSDIITIHKNGEGSLVISDGIHYNDDTFRVVLDLNPTSGNHGIWSSGYMNNGTFTSNSQWMLIRGSDGKVQMNGNASTATIWETARTFTVGGTGKPVNGSADISWSMNEIMGTSDSTEFYRGDKTWSNELTGDISIGSRGVTSGPSSITYSNRITIVPYFHTGGPWYIKSGDDASNAYLALYYNTTQLMRIKHDGTQMIDWKGNANTSTKWASAQTVYVTLGTASKTTTIQGGSSSAHTLGVDGTLGVGNGGTGKASWTKGGIIYASATNTLAQIADGSADKVLRATASATYSWLAYTSAATASTIVYRDSSKNFSAGTITATLSGNASTATTLQTARTIWGQSFNGSANITGQLDITNADIIISNSDTTTRQIRWTVGANDQARVAAGATAANGGWMEIATADDGNEPIYVRQYTGTFSTIKRTLTLLDANGNTTTPGGFGVANTSNSSGLGISLYGGAYNGQPDYGMMFAGTATFGKFGDVSNDWATYFTINRNDTRGWIFKSGTGSGNNYASISGRGHFTGTLTPSSWIDGQRYMLAAYNIADYSNTGSYNPWIRATNTWASGDSSAKKGYWFSFGTLGTRFYWIGSVSTRTANSYDHGMSFDISNGVLYATFNGSLTGNVTGNCSGSSGSCTGNAAGLVDGTKTMTSAYNKSGLAYADYTWLAGWNGYELRAVAKSQFAQASHNHAAGDINSGTLGTARGGTGNTSFTQWGVIYANPATKLVSTAAGTSGYLLQGNGSAAPSWIQATNANTASTIVKRDASGNFSAGTITASLTGNCSGSSGSCTGNAATASKITNITSSDAASSSNTWRYAWFSYNDNTTGRPAYDTTYAYQSSTGMMKVGRISCWPSAGSNSYNEGIRIHAATNGWATLMLCDTNNTGDTGTAANSWGIFNNSGTLYITRNGSSSGTAMLYCNSSDNYFRVNTRMYGAVWNDYAEYRQAITTEGGRVVYDDNTGIMKITTKRLQPAARIISDTYGFSVGESDTAHTPIGVSGRVLAYPYQNKENYKVGDAVCAAPNGTVDIMTREEIKEYPDRIIGIVSEIPHYPIWSNMLADGGRGKAEIEVKGRIWIYVK